MEDECEASIQLQSTSERIPLKHVKIKMPNRYEHTCISSSEASSGAGDESGSESDDSEPPVKRSRVKNKRSHDNSSFSEGELSGDSPDGYEMFDPEWKKQTTKWHLAKQQKAFVDKYFSTYIKDEVIRETVLKDAPVPSHTSLTVPELASD